MHEKFIERVVNILNKDSEVLGLAIGGSWITKEIDEYSDLDFIIITKSKISSDKDKMLSYAKRIGNLLNGFTGEHVGEPRVLICLYEDPILHVDLKFLTLDEFKLRVENPEILIDKKGLLKKVIEESEYNFPYPSYQWIEDRFWIWIHYCLLKIGRGENMEAHDFFGYLRMTVFGPLLLIKNDQLPRGVRKVETQLPKSDYEELQATIPKLDSNSLFKSVHHSIDLYRKLRVSLFDKDVILRHKTEVEVLKYLKELEDKTSSQ